MNKRVHEEKCDYCGKLEHYAKGLCKNCYNRLRNRGTLEYYIHPTASYYERNKEKIKEKTKQYYKKNKEHYSNVFKKYYEKNKEKESERKRQWYLKNKEKILEKQKKYREKKKNRRYKK